MERAEKVKLMKDKIIHSAMKEFNDFGYEAASINHICKYADISKGIIYHYFKDKDDLYLSCVKTCFESYVGYFYEHGCTYIEKGNINGFINLRIHFFADFPDIQSLFFHALLRTPKRLIEQVKQLRFPVKQLNHTLYRNYLATLTLRDHMTMEKALQYLDFMENAYNEYFRSEAESSEDLSSVIHKHEQKIPEWIDMFIHGIAKEGTIHE